MLLKACACSLKNKVFIKTKSLSVQPWFCGWFKVKDFIKTKVFTRLKGMGGWVGGGMGGRMGGRRNRWAALGFRV
jgi:hypothetical protein